MKLAKWLSLVKIIAPAVLVAVPKGEKIAPLVPVIVGAIEDAELAVGSTGAEKKIHVLNAVEAGIAVANATGKVALDAAEVKAVASDGIDAVIGTLHVIDGAKVVKAHQVKTDAPQ